MGSAGKGDWRKVQCLFFCSGVTKVQTSALSKMEVLSTI